MIQKKDTKNQSGRQLLTVVAAITALSMLLVAGLAAAGWIERIDARVADWVSRGGREGYGKMLPGWVPWSVAACGAAGVCLAILGTVGGWRWAVLWLGALAVVAGWAPVLSLAAHVPEIAAPWIACFWSGMCAMVYAWRHRMPSDSRPEERP